MMILLYGLLWIKPGDQAGPDCQNVRRVHRSIIETIHLSVYFEGYTKVLRK